MAWTVKLASYEGPLDLLLDLLAKHQLDIAEVAVAQVTAQYLAYLESLPQEDLDLYSEFLVMGARLVALKARLLLPPEKGQEEAMAAEEPDDYGPTLVECLARYKRFKEAAQVLEELAERRSRYWDRGPDAEAYRLVAAQIDPLAGIAIQDLQRVFKEVVLRRAAVPQVSPPRQEVSFEELYGLIRRRLSRQGSFALQEVFCDLRGLVYGLLALLIMSHQGEVRLEQHELWGPIYVYARALAQGGAVG